ncbi:MAG TPA: hypothetical protein VGK67_09765 [Myxococcales bacterium]
MTRSERIAAIAFVGLLAAACRSSTPLPAPTLAAVTPAAVERGQSVAVTLSGDRFYVRPEVDLENGPTRLHATFTAALGSTSLIDVKWIDPQNLTATVPATLAEGTYDLTVEGPYGKASLSKAFVVTPPKLPDLKATLTVPAEAGVNQKFAIVLKVENPGTAATAVVPGSLTATGAGAINLQPPTHAAVDLAGGASTEFTWTATGSAFGAVELEVPVLGQGGATLATARASMAIRGSASLAGTASAAPDKVSVGQTFIGVLGVSNPTASPALGVSASVEIQPAGAATVTSPPAAQDIAAKGSTAFSFSLVAQQPGQVSIIFRASGHDGSQSPVYLNPVIATVLVQTPPRLSGTATVLPSSPTIGQPVTLTLTVTNSGEVDASSVAPSAVTFSGTGTVAPDGAPPTPQDVPAGESRDFTWTFTATGAGSLSFLVGARGSDANNPLSAVDLPPVAAGPITISPTRLEVSLDASPSALNIGQDLAVRLTVRNSGSAAANAVAPSLSLGGTGSAALQSGPTPATADLAPSNTQVFEWTWRATAAGMVSFEASAAGLDAVSGATVASGLVSAGPIAVGKRAQLSGVLVAPNFVASGAAFDVQLDLTNSGDTPARGVAPGSLTFGGTASATVASGPTPATVDVAAGGSANLKWTIQPTSEGSLTLSVGAQGIDALDLKPVTLDPVGASVAVGVHASLSAELMAPSLVGPNSAFTLTLKVANTGAADATAVTPTSITVAGTGGATATAGPTPAQADIAAGKSADFTWTFSTGAAGLVDLEAGASGTEQPSGQAVSAPPAHASLELAEAQRLLADPFGDGTSSSFLFGYRGEVYVGPRQDGSGAVRFQADGSAPESVTFALQRDAAAPSLSTNSSSAPYPGFGAPGCARNTGACGPDNENGRAFLASVPLFGDEWLFGAGAASGADRLHHVYLSNDPGPALSFPYVDLTPALENQTFSVSAVHAFKDRLYLGLPDTSVDRPYLVALLKTPAEPGLDAVLDTDVLHLDAGVLPDIGAHSGNAAPVQLIDSMADFNDRLYLFNNGGCARSTTATPRPAGVAANDWTGCTPTTLDWTRKKSLSTAKTSGIEPADKATPQAAIWQGRLYALRNTTTGPQLWSCNPSLKADGMACDPKKDWSQAASNTTGDQRLSQFNNPKNAAATLLVATPTHLYVGFDNADGVALFRTGAAVPRLASDFEGAAGCAAQNHPATCQPFGGLGLGDSGARKIYGAVSLSYGGRGYLYVLAGDGAGPLRVFRVDE